MIDLHPQLEQDCIILGEFSLSTLLLINDANYPWFILLPNREGITELHHLSTDDQQQFLKESMFFSHCLESIFNPDKINIAALGNMVPQLHVHHIARFTTDASWPAPVWGKATSVPYSESQIKTLKEHVFREISYSSDTTFTPN